MLWYIIFVLVFGLKKKRKKSLPGHSLNANGIFFSRADCDHGGGVYMSINGAGGTSGGIGRFFIGLTMLIAGGYLFMNSIRVTSNFRLGFGFRHTFSSFTGFSTSGYVLIPFIFGIGMVFYDAKNVIGWFLVFASLVMLVFGIISTLNFRMVHLSVFMLISILVLMIGGLGLFLSSLRSL
jgi:hypothetical protein